MLPDILKKPFAPQEKDRTLRNDEQNPTIDQPNSKHETKEKTHHNLIKADHSKTESAEVEEEQYKHRRHHKLIKTNDSETEQAEPKKEKTFRFGKEGREERQEERVKRQEESEKLKEERWKEKRTRKIEKEERKEKKEERKSETAWKKKKRRNEKEDEDGGTYITQNGIKVTGQPENGIYEFHKEKKRIMITYKNGKKNGSALTYNKEGTLVSRVHYIDDNLNGPAVQYYASGKEKVILNYKDNQKEGVLITHSSNGMKLFETTYVKNVKEGKFTAFDMFGDIAQVCYFKNGIKHGPCTTYFPKSYGGHICRISNYENGLQSDIEQVFYTTGEPLQSTTYDKGRALNYPVNFDKSGKILVDPAANKNRNAGG